MKKSKLTPISAKKKLITYHNYKECDFYQLDEEIYLNCKDNVGEKATDLIEEIQLTFREKYEQTI